MALTSPQEADVPPDGPSEALEIPNTHLEPPQPIETRPISSTPVEMSKLEPRPRSSSLEGSKDVTSTHNREDMSTENRNAAETTSALSPLPLPPPEPSILSPSENASHTTAPANPLLTRQFTTPAIGPSSDQPTPISKEADITGPTLVITLLLPTGARHPYRMDQKYLKKRNVNVLDNNPIRMSVYTLRELIWREWREEWELRPSSPSSIRLIHFGKLLDDKYSLEESKFKNDTPNVVHMTVKPQDIVDEEDAKLAKQGGRDRDGNERSPGCRCVLM
ncbi:MAG: hypothetical protein M1830_010415 [Pleopsidium flavum]|nr:MAG: hypothetical protein M1830_010425 [Pleopsidium flavum]KAI9873902.1 MAG: hypothetical protein M1830_010415 [Pleopsidium flavum]